MHAITKHEGWLGEHACISRVFWGFQVHHPPTWTPAVLMKLPRQTVTDTAGNARSSPELLWALGRGVCAGILSCSECFTSPPSDCAQLWYRSSLRLLAHPLFFPVTPILPFPTQDSQTNIWPEDTGQGTLRNLQGKSTPSLVPNQGLASSATPSQQQRTAGKLCTGHRDHPCSGLYGITTF